MKSVVIRDEYSEVDFRPPVLMNKYLELVAKDVAEFFVKSDRLQDSGCPACKFAEALDAFKRFGLQYRECVNCGTLYVTPRPHDIDLSRYYGHSPSRAFWRDELVPMTAKKREIKVIRPRVAWIVDSTRQYCPQAQSLMDINTTQYGYVAALAQDKFFAKKIFCNPFLRSGDLKLGPGLEVADIAWQQAALREKVDVVSAFEVLDRTADVEAMCLSLRNLIKPGGLLFMTAILASGFDLQVLWEKADHIYPPDRLNVFSVEGLKLLAERHQFQILEFSTPGLLDLEALERGLSRYPDMGLPRFFQYLIKRKDAAAKKNFQEFLQANLLSSYGRILLRKK